MQHIVPYTPQKKIDAKKNNHTLKELENCMIQFKGLSLHLPARAINCANYIFNCTLEKVVKNIAL
jgi:hypothetical protein